MKSKGGAKCEVEGQKKQNNVRGVQENQKGRVIGNGKGQKLW